MKIIEKDVNELIPYENNPRHNDNAVAAVAKSIQEFGFKVPLVVDIDNVIVAGHTRYKAAKRLGLATVPCMVADDLTDEQIRAFRLVDNKTAEKANWDMDLLSAELAQIKMDLTDYGFLLEPVNVSDIQECDFTITPEQSVQPGDLYALGNHRLLCGDCCDTESIAKLMDGKAADMYLTDPPYNVNYQSKAGKIQNDHMDDDDFRDFLSAAFSVANEVMRPGAAFYIWHSETAGMAFRTACAAVCWQVRQCLIWNKDRFVIGRQDYQWKHEPCLYGWKDGAAHYFRACRKNNTVFTDDLEDKTKDELIQLIREIDMELTVIDEEKPMVNAEHPTMKPVKLMARLIANSTKPGDIVFDGFGGSGSTLMACEQLNRCCYTSELDPVYADVILRRWENLTGRQAVKIN